MPKAAHASSPRRSSALGARFIRDNAFPRSARLLAAPEFGRVFADPDRSRDEYFTILSLRTGEPGSRLGLAISKKQIRRAVDRNRLKRHIRESFRQHRKQLAGLDLVVMARPAAGLADKKRLNMSLAALMRKLISDSVR